MVVFLLDTGCPVLPHDDPRMTHAFYRQWLFGKFVHVKGAVTDKWAPIRSQHYTCMMHRTTSVCYGHQGSIMHVHSTV